MVAISAPGKVENVKIKLHGAAKDIVVTWDEPGKCGSSSIIAYTTVAQWYDPGTAMVEPVSTLTKEVDPNAKKVTLSNGSYPVHNVAIPRRAPYNRGNQDSHCFCLNFLLCVTG